MKKVFLFFLGILLFSHVFASNDCNFVRGRLGGVTGMIAIIEDADVGFTPLNVNHIYPDAAYKQVLYNLKAYCCESHTLDEDACRDDKSDFSDVYPESLFLYDHLVDVGLRRLDAEVGLMYGLDADPVGLEWREYINEVANSSDANFALSMSNEFEKFRATENKEYDGDLYFDSWDTFQDYGENKLKSIASDSTYSSTNLYQRYKELCGVTASIYLSNAIDVSVNNISSIRENYNYCQVLVSERIQNETIYTKSLIQEKSLALLKKSVNAYATEYYGKTRLLNLQETIFVISDLFLTVAKMAPEGTFKCN